MEISRFNWVSKPQRSGDRVALNFLTRAADFIADEDATCLVGDPQLTQLTEEDARQLVERGYAFPADGDEAAILRQLADWERSASHPVYVLHFGAPRRSEPRLDEVGDSITRALADRDGISRPELVLYAETLADPLPGWSDVERLVVRCRDLRLSTSAVVTAGTVSEFADLLRADLLDALVLVLRLRSAPPVVELGALADDCVRTLIDRGRAASIELRVKPDSVASLPEAMKHLIVRGWPFHGNFECRLAPAGGGNCLFGSRFSRGPALLERIFGVFGQYPQTEFCSLGQWVGVRQLHALVWHGRPAGPSLHFCHASRKLLVFSGDGGVFPCPRLAEAPGSVPPEMATPEGFRAAAASILSDCAACRLLPACGGGCKHDALAANRGRASCPRVAGLLEAAVRGWSDELSAKADRLEQIHRGEAQ